MVDSPFEWGIAIQLPIADNDFLNDLHNLIYTWILLMLISLYVPEDFLVSS